MSCHVPPDRFLGETTYLKETPIGALSSRFREEISAKANTKSQKTKYDSSA